MRDFPIPSYGTRVEVMWKSSKVIRELVLMNKENFCLTIPYVEICLQWRHVIVTFLFLSALLYFSVHHCRSQRSYACFFYKAKTMVALSSKTRGYSINLLYSKLEECIRWILFHVRWIICHVYSCVFSTTNYWLYDSFIIKIFCYSTVCTGLNCWLD